MYADDIMAWAALGSAATPAQQEAVRLAQAQTAQDQQAAINANVAAAQNQQQVAAMQTQGLYSPAGNVQASQAPQFLAKIESDKAAAKANLDAASTAYNDLVSSGKYVWSDPQYINARQAYNAAELNYQTVMKNSISDYNSLTGAVPTSSGGGGTATGKSSNFGDMPSPYQGGAPGASGGLSTAYAASTLNPDGTLKPSEGSSLLNSQRFLELSNAYLPNRADYTNPATIGDLTTDRTVRNVDTGFKLINTAFGTNFGVSQQNAQLGVLGMQQSNAQAAGNVRQVQFYNTELNKVGENIVGAASEYHFIGKMMDMPIPSNPLEYRGDLAVEFLKGAPFKNGDFFSPVSGEMSGYLPDKGLGLQQYSWNIAVANDRGQPQDLNKNFMPAISYLANAEGNQGVYGNLYGGANYKGSPSSDGMRSAYVPNLSDSFFQKLSNSVAGVYGVTPYVIGQSQKSSASSSSSIPTLSNMVFTPDVRAATAGSSDRLVGGGMLAATASLDSYNGKKPFVSGTLVSSKPSEDWAQGVPIIGGLLSMSGITEKTSKIPGAYGDVARFFAPIENTYQFPAVTKERTSAKEGGADYTFKYIGADNKPTSFMEFAVGSPYEKNGKTYQDYQSSDLSKVTYTPTKTTMSASPFDTAIAPAASAWTSVNDAARSIMPPPQVGEAAVKTSSLFNPMFTPMVVSSSLAGMASDVGLPISKGTVAQMNALNPMTGSYTTAYNDPLIGIASMAIGGGFGAGTRVVGAAAQRTAGAFPKLAPAMEFAGGAINYGIAGLYGVSVAERGTSGFADFNPATVMPKARGLVTLETAGFMTGFGVGYNPSSVTSAAKGVYASGVRAYDRIPSMKDISSGISEQIFQTRQGMSGVTRLSPNSGTKFDFDIGAPTKTNYAKYASEYKGNPTEYPRGGEVGMFIDRAPAGIFKSTSPSRSSSQQPIVTDAMRYADMERMFNTLTAIEGVKSVAPRSMMGTTRTTTTSVGIMQQDMMIGQVEPSGKSSFLSFERSKVSPNIAAMTENVGSTGKKIVTRTDNININPYSGDTFIYGNRKTNLVPSGGKQQVENFYGSFNLYNLKPSVVSNTPARSFDTAGIASASFFNGKDMAIGVKASNSDGYLITAGREFNIDSSGKMSSIVKTKRTPEIGNVLRDLVESNNPSTINANKYREFRARRAASAMKPFEPFTTPTKKSVPSPTISPKSASGGMLQLDLFAPSTSQRVQASLRGMFGELAPRAKPVAKTQELRIMEANLFKQKTVERNTRRWEGDLTSESKANSLSSVYKKQSMSTVTGSSVAAMGGMATIPYQKQSKSLDAISSELRSLQRQSPKSLEQISKRAISVREQERQVSKRTIQEMRIDTTGRRKTSVIQKPDIFTDVIPKRTPTTRELARIDTRARIDTTTDTTSRVIPRVTPVVTPWSGESTGSMYDVGFTPIGEIKPTPIIPPPSIFNFGGGSESASGGRGRSKRKYNQSLISGIFLMGGQTMKAPRQRAPKVKFHSELTPKKRTRATRKRR